MLEAMIKTVIEKTVKENYPHLKLPGAVYAKVTKAQDLGSHYEYSLKILDETGAVDEAFPEIPKVKSKLVIESGKTVAILLLYGQLNAYIVGEVV